MKKQTFKAVDLFDRRRRVIFDKKSGNIIQYCTAQESGEPTEQKPEPVPAEEPENPNQIKMFEL